MVKIFLTLYEAQGYKSNAKYDFLKLSAANTFSNKKTIENFGNFNLN